MSDYKEKPKRQPFQERSYLYLAIGILIGIILAAIAFVSFFMIAGSETQLSQVIYEPISATPFPLTINGQGMQATVLPMPTVVANRIQSAKISPDGNWIAAIKVDNNISTIFLNPLDGGDLLAPLYSEQGYYNHVIFSPDGHYLIATVEQFTGPGDALLFDVQTREIVARFSQIQVAAFSTDSKNLALVSANTGIRIMDTATQNLIASLQFDAEIVQAVAYSTRNQIAVAADSQVKVYHVDSLSAPPSIITLNSSFIYNVAFHPDGEHLAIAGENMVQIINLSDETRTYIGFESPQIFALAFSQDGEQLAVGGGNSGIGEARLMVFRWNQAGTLSPDPNYYVPITLSAHNHVVMDVTFTPDDNLLSASWDGTVRLWNLETQSEIWRLGY
jgi:WD40 repeat protein